MKKGLLSVFLLVLLIMVSTAFAGATPIKLGLVGPMTEGLAPYGEGVRDGALLAVAEINAKGGIMGRQVELIVYDNQGDPTQTINLVNRLISQDRIVGLIGPVISSTSRVAGPVVQRHGIPMITPTATAVDVTLAGDYIFRVCFLDSYQGAAAVNYALETGAKKAGILFKAGDPYSVGLRDVFKANFEKAGGTVLDLAYNSGDTDFSAQLTRMKNEGVDVVYAPYYYDDAVLSLAQANAIGLEAPFIGTDGWDSQDLLDHVGLAAVGTVITTHYSPSDEREKVQNFLANFRSSYGHSPIVLAALGYDAAGLMLDAIERAQSVNSEQIRNAIAETEGFYGVTGENITLDSNRNPIKDITIIRVIEVDGVPQFEFVTQVGY